MLHFDTQQVVNSSQQAQLLQRDRAMLRFTVIMLCRRPALSVKLSNKPRDSEERLQNDLDSVSSGT